MPLTSLTKLQGTSFGNVTATSLTSTTVTSNTVTSNTVSSPAYSVVLTAGETLAALDAVYVEPTLTPGTAGRVYKMDADVLIKSTQAFFVGFALASASAAATVTIQTAGIVSGFTGLVPGAMYYANSSPGTIINTLYPVGAIEMAAATSGASAAVALSLAPASGNTVSFDATSNNGSFSTTKTFSHTTGSNTTLLLVTIRDDSSGVSGVTFNGVSMTQVTAGPAGYGYGVYVYYLGNPSIGTYNVVVTTSTGSIGAVSTSYKGTTTSPEASATVYSASGTPITATVSGLTSGAWGWLTVHNRTGIVPTVISNITARGNAGAPASFGVFDTNSPGARQGKPLHPLPVGIAISSTQLLINTRKREAEEAENVSAVYGYAMGGHSGAIVATTDRITFSTSVTAASTASNLSGVRYVLAGVSDGAVYGYAMGGYTGAAVATTDRITFSTSVTAASTVSNLSGVRYSLSGVSDGAVYGYAMGGYTGAAVATTDRITFSTSVTAASTVSNLSAARYGLTGVSDGAVYGYAMGGHNGSAYAATTDRITFSTSVTAASTVSNLSVARYYPTGVSDGAVYGYAMGGTSGAHVATTDRITFSTSVTAASTVSNLSVARYGLAGVSDGAVYGYAMGGYSTDYVATTDRITFSTSVTAASTVSNLSGVRYVLAGLSDGAV